MCLRELVNGNKLSTSSLRLLLNIKCSSRTKASTKERRRSSYASSVTKPAKRTLKDLQWMIKLRNYSACYRCTTQRRTRIDRGTPYTANSVARLNKRESLSKSYKRERLTRKMAVILVT